MGYRFGVARAAAALAILCSAVPPAVARHAHSHPSGPAPRLTAEEVKRLDHLEQELTAAEDIRSIEKLQRAYGYYVDKGMWADVAELFTDDAVANYPAGIYVGKTSIREHLFMNVGGGKMGDIGLGDGRLYNHMQIQPVVHLDPGGKSAKGRWRALAMFGSYGGGATWAEGIYEIGYQKDHGVWKIHTLDYYSGFGAPYQTGWVPPKTPRTGPPGGRKLAHPPDRERKMECDGFPAACIAPFHYDNPGTSASANIWTTVDERPVHTSGSSSQRLAELAHRALLLEDEQKIENLQRIYGYYIDRGRWDQVADLFVSDGTFESGLSGVYVGRAHIRKFLGLTAPEGLGFGRMNDHIQLQTIVDVSPNGLTARARSRELDMIGEYGGTGTWMEGVYENTYVKQGGKWKFKSLHFYPTFISDYAKGWAKDAQPVPTASTEVPPDKPPTEIYQIYPKAYVPAYHYRNPVTGQPPHYPPVGAPSPEMAAVTLQPLGGRVRLPEVDDPGSMLAAAERRLDRVKDFWELENLESAYGYYLDKNLFNNLADLFATDGSMELAQRGVYKGRERVRQFLLHVFTRDGKEGPVEGRLGNHLQLQPVIDVAADGMSAKIRSRMLQQMSMGGRASIGGAIYENEAVKENGVWKFKVDHAYNTFTASYTGGWAQGASGYMPGPNPDFPWDAPPTQVFDMFPVVYEIPYHYVNPVTGAPEMKVATPVGMPPRIAVALRDIGPKIDGPRTTGLYAPLQPKEPYHGVALFRDLHYGPHERNVLDIFAAPGQGPAPAGAQPEAGAQAATGTAAPAEGPRAGGAAAGPGGPGGAGAHAPRPVLVFIHGGGFSRGAKSTPGSPFYDNIGVWAVDHGLVGVTINYRLAPQYQWPSGIEDLTLVVAWLKSHIAQYGGDPHKIVLWGHSAGAAHVADYVSHQATGLPVLPAEAAAAAAAAAEQAAKSDRKARHGRKKPEPQAAVAPDPYSAAYPKVGPGSEPQIAGAILTSGFYELGDKVSIWKDYYGDDVTQYAARSSLPGLLQTTTPLFVTYAELDPANFQPDSVKLIAERAREGRPVRSLHLPGHSHLSETFAVGSGDESLSAPVLEFIHSLDGKAQK
ncbi:MAG TPA: nuclear transport factor 2 family protein [Steroidobacteraceae bacterium]|nr:nuclear transport factor 2 family protein [Steroidobacteraceae bacterium]